MGEGKGHQQLMDVVANVDVRECRIQELEICVGNMLEHLPADEQSPIDGHKISRLVALWQTNGLSASDAKIGV